MSPKVFAACVMIALLWPPAVHAASITNRDDMSYKVSVIEEKSRQDNVLEPSGVLEGICEKGCIIRLNDSDKDDYELEGSDVVSIEDGFLYYDGPAAAAVGKVGDAVQPPARDVR